MISGRSSRRLRCSGERRLITYLSSRISASVRPRSCSRITYCATRSSCDERWNRNEKRSRNATPRLYPRRVRRRSHAGRVAERTLSGVDDLGNEERIVFWIDRRPGALWAVGRSVNPQLRTTDEPRTDDVVFEGYELEEALERANEALEDDVRVLEIDGRSADVKPFTR